MSDVVVRLIIARALTLVKGFITSTGFQLLERQLSWVITFITKEIYLFNTIMPQLDVMCQKKNYISSILAKVMVVESQK